MEINIEGVTAEVVGNGMIFSFEKAFYMLANRDNFDFKYVEGFDNHYANKSHLKRVLVEEHGISVITTVEFFENKYFTSVSVFMDAQLDNITLLNIFRIVTESIATVAYKKGAINMDELSNELGNYYNMVYVACREKSEKIISFDISLYYEVKELVSQALEKSLEYII